METEFEWHGEDYDDSTLHENCVPSDEALTHVLENQFDEVRDAVAESEAEDWLADSVDNLELLNIVSSYDREQLRSAIRDVLNTRSRDGSSPSADEFFPVATEVAKFLERTRSPYAESYGLTESVEWVRDLINVTRIIREILFALPEKRQISPGMKAEPSNSAAPSKTLDQLTEALQYRRVADGIGRSLRRVLDGLNEILSQGVVYQLRPEGRKLSQLVCELDPSKNPLHVALAFWMSEYLGKHEQYVDLAVCVECGKFFARQRRDNIYCSKTCQNRIAYKRKKIFVAGVLREVDIKATPKELRAGLCLYHPRFGLGVIEKVLYERRRLRLQFDDSESQVEGSGPAISAKAIAISNPIPEGKSAREFFEETKATYPKTPVSWQEIVDPASLNISARFLSGIRQFNRWEIESRTKDVTFYAVENPTSLAELL